MDYSDLRQIHEGLVLLGHQANIVSKIAGHWDAERTPAEVLDNVKRELEDSLLGLTGRSVRSRKIPSFTYTEEHLADAIICIMDFSYANGLNVGAAVAAKMRYNEKLAKLRKASIDKDL